jgi:hypothetical protein
MINKISVAACIATLLFMHKVSAQTHDASVNLAPMPFGNYSGNYSFNFKEDMSAGIVLGHQNLEISSGEDKVGFKGFYIAPEYRYFFNPGKGNDGAFVGGYLKYRSMRTTGDANTGMDKSGRLVEYDEKNNGVSAGVLLGNTWVSKKGIMFSLWGGMGYYLFNKVSYTNNYDPDPGLDLKTNLPSFDFRFGLSLGYRFGM